MTNISLGRRVSGRVCDATVLEVIDGPTCDIIEFFMERGPIDGIRQIYRSIYRGERQRFL